MVAWDVAVVGAGPIALHAALKAAVLDHTRFVVGDLRAGR